MEVVKLTGIVMGVLSIPLGWLWMLNQSAHKKIRENEKALQEEAEKLERKIEATKLILAGNHFTKPEVRDLVDREIRPLKDTMEEIKGDVKYLVRISRRKDDD